MQNQPNEFDLIKELLEEGVSFDYKRVCLSQMKRLFGRKVSYQVYSDNSKHKFVGEFKSSEEAVSKFLELKRKIK